MEAGDLNPPRRRKQHFVTALDVVDLAWPSGVTSHHTSAGVSPPPKQRPAKPLVSTRPRVAMHLPTRSCCSPARSRLAHPRRLPGLCRLGLPDFIRSWPHEKQHFGTSISPSTKQQQVQHPHPSTHNGAGTELASSAEPSSSRRDPNEPKLTVGRSASKSSCDTD
jgi:hypothetical protein